MRKIVVLLCCALMIFGIVLCSFSYADVPEGVKNSYTYNQNDSSIILVKERLKELGYFSENAQFSNAVSEDLKNAVISFQKQNGMKADGVIDRELLEVLFSDQAVSKDERRSGSAAQSNVPTAKATSVNTKKQSFESNPVNFQEKEAAGISSSTIVFIVVVLIVVSAIVVIYLRKYYWEKSSTRSVAKQKGSAAINWQNSKSQGGANNLSHKEWSAAREKGNTQIGIDVKHRENNRIQEKLLRETVETKKTRQPATMNRQNKQFQRDMTRKDWNEKWDKKNIEYDIEKRRRIESEIQEKRQREEAEAQKEWQYAVVKKASARYKRMKELFAEYKIATVFPAKYRLQYVFHSIRAYEEVVPINALAYLARENQTLLEAYEHVRHNRKMMKAVFDALPAAGVRISSADNAYVLQESRFIEIEKDLCDELMNKMIIDLDIHLDLYYSSLNGRKRTSKLFIAHFDSLQKALAILPIPDIEYASSQEEREKMTPSLRYKILKRDGFRCVLCGASADDGVKLHVDHIMPVSKGGKTEESNLRTLCERCNIGKGAKYDPLGLN